MKDEITFAMKGKIMAMTAPVALQSLVNANNAKTVADTPANSTRSANVGAARSALEESKEKTSLSPASSTEVNISENGRARLQAEQTNAAATPQMNQAANAQQVARNAPVATASRTADTQNDPMLTGTAPVTPAAANATTRPAAPTGNEQAATPGTPRAEAGRQQVEAVAVQAEAQRNSNQVNRQDVSPVVAQSGIATYRGIFSN